MGNYNPDWPYVIGMQWAPLVADAVLLDTASEVGYTFKARHDYSSSEEGLGRVRLFATAPPPGRPTRKELLVNLYRSDVVAGTGPIRKLVIACTGGELLGGAALAGGAAQPNDAVHNPSDPRHITLTGPNAACRFWFDTGSSQVQGALRYRRILDVSVLYVMSGPFADLSPAVTLGLERPSAGLNWVMDETLTGPALHTEVTTPRRARLGELNPWWSTADTPLTTKTRLPWKWAGGLAPTSGLIALSGSGGTNVNVRLQTSAAAAASAVFQVHYLALEITYGEENRVAGGGLDISDGAALIGGYYYEIPLVEMYNFGYDVPLRAGYEYAVTVGQAYSGQMSVASPVPVPVDRLGSVGPFPGHRGVLLRKTLREGSVPTVETVSEMPAIVMYAGASAPGTADISSHGYLAQAVGTLYDHYGPGATMQRLLNDVAGTYVWARFYARHLPGTKDPLELFQVDPADTWVRLGPSASITVDEFDALPEVAGGWKEVTLRLEPPYVASGAGGTTCWAFYSSADGEVPWQVLGADAEPHTLLGSSPSQPGYGDLGGYATIDGNSDVSVDLTLMLAQEMDAVTGLAVQSAVQPLTVVDENCQRPVGGIPTGIHYHQLSWTAINTAVVAGWGHYEVQRQDDTMPSGEWETIAKVVEPNVTAVDDYEARVGVESRYRIRMVHRTGIAGPWSAPVAATIPAPGVTGTGVDVGVLILTSNRSPAANLAYVMSWERQSAEEFTFPEAGQVELQAMFDRDYRTAFRPLERGGVEFTRTVLVNAAAVPPGTMDKGFTDLRDLAWDTLPYVCVRDELGNRWLAALLVPSASVRRSRKRGHLHLAQLTVVEVTDTPAPLDGGPAPCEGLRPEGTVDAVTADADTPPGLDPIVVDDSFTRDVPAGGLGSTETPGLPWTIDMGPPEDVSVTGGAGRIKLVEYRNSNPFFETTVAGWTTFGCTLVRSTAQAHEGVASGLVTPDGVTAQVRIESNQVTGAAVGVTWRAVAWVRCAVARNVVLSINWFDAASTYLNTSSSSPIAVAANTWTRLTFSTAPTNPATAKASVNVVMDGTPPASHLLYVDEVALGPSPAGKGIVTGPDRLDVDIRARFRLDTAALTQPVNGYLLGRYVDANNHYLARLAFNPDGTLGVGLEKLVGGTLTTIAPLEIQEDRNWDPVTWAPGDWIWLRMQVRGSVVRAGAWKDGGDFYNYPAQVVDSSLAVAGRTGVRGALTAGNTNVTATMDVDDFRVREPMADFDIRVELRTSADQWAVAVEHYTSDPDGFVSNGWDFMVSEVETCVEVFGQDVFYQCVSTDVLQVVTRQRRWVRATYEQDAGGGLARMDLYTSLDGVAWTLVYSATDYPEPLDLDPGFFSLWVRGGVTVSRVEVRNGIDGPIITAPDFEALPKGTTSFVDAQGLRWEVNGLGICGTA
ncbi:hypothetical protein [Micromonospora sp. HM5-17]|uniref:hypothetical protein n=1 Tax=Micromonospora sp. HM5-17 TaxID=2487710 RepID=UPI000F49DD77|nr:hypothetical protein [Micromonospora sp. HM5-17]ROT27206.1 hypothetical protein EF879_23415 [Micromonospora sp. HM5-17]